MNLVAPSEQWHRLPPDRVWVVWRVAPGRSATTIRDDSDVIRARYTYSSIKPAGLNWYPQAVTSAVRWSRVTDTAANIEWRKMVQLELHPESVYFTCVRFTRMPELSILDNAHESFTIADDDAPRWSLASLAVCLLAPIITANGRFIAMR